MQLAPELALPADRPLVTTAALAELALAEPHARVAAVRAGGGVAALVARQIALRSERPIIMITASAERARQLESDLRFAAGSLRRVLVFDAGEANPYADVAVDRRAAQLRLASLFELAQIPDGLPSGAAPFVVVAA